LDYPAHSFLSYLSSPTSKILLQNSMTILIDTLFPVLNRNLRNSLSSSASRCRNPLTRGESSRYPDLAQSSPLYSHFPFPSYSSSLVISYSPSSCLRSTLTLFNFSKFPKKLGDHRFQHGTDSNIFPYWGYIYLFDPQLLEISNVDTSLWILLIHAENERDT